MKLLSSVSFYLPLFMTADKPSMVTITVVPPTSLNITWRHSVAGIPTSYYLITYVCLANGSNSAYHEKKSLTVPPTDTSVVLDDVEVTAGSVVIIVIVTSVSGNVSRSSDLQYLNICKSPVHRYIRMIIWRVHLLCILCSHLNCSYFFSLHCGPSSFNSCLELSNISYPGLAF